LARTRAPFVTGWVVEGNRYRSLVGIALTKDWPGPRRGNLPAPGAVTAESDPEYPEREPQQGRG